MQPQVRTATQDDLQAIITIHRESMRYLAGIAPAGFGESMAETSEQGELEEQFAEYFADDSGLVLVAELDGAAVGFLAALIEDCGDDLISSPFLTIEFVELTPAAQGQGMATALLTAAEDFARKRSITSIDLIVWENNTAARRLYERMGYQCLELRLAKKL